MSAGPVELRVLAVPALQGTPNTPRGAERDLLIRRAKALSWISLAYMSVEGAVGILAATLAGSVALLGFGLDSVIEVASAAVVAWQFSATDHDVRERRERRALRWISRESPCAAKHTVRGRAVAPAAGSTPSGTRQD